MTDYFVEGRSKEHAVLLLAAARDLDADSSVVRTTTNGYLVPEEVANQAGLGDTPPKEKPKPAKKTAAKKTSAKKAASSKSNEE